MRITYLVLALIGLVVPYYFLSLFLREYGLNPALFVDQLFANNISTFFAADLIITAVAFFVFVYREALRYNIPYAWLYIILTLLVGPSFAFPLFLYVRESKLNPRTA